MTRRASEKMKIKNAASKTGCATRRFVGFDIDIPNGPSVRRRDHDITNMNAYPKARRIMIRRLFELAAPRRAVALDGMTAGQHSTARRFVERSFDKIEPYRRIATRYDKLAADCPAFVMPTAILIRQRANEPTPCIARFRGR
jgi:transposase